MAAGKGHQQPHLARSRTDRSRIQFGQFPAIQQFELTLRLSYESESPLIFEEG